MNVTGSRVRALIVLFLAIAAGVSQLLSILLFEVTPRDPTIFGGVVVIIVLTMILQFGAMFALSIISGPQLAAGPLMIVFFALNALVNFLTTGYYYVFQMVTYYDLRIRKEGLDLELASEAMTPA